jgi:selenocysteine lyase/cysteine desulfurase
VALEARKISISARCGLLRISPHFYNTREEIDVLFEALAELRS